MNTTATQLRVRLTPEAARKYASLPPSARLRVVSLVLAAHAEGIDLGDLLAMRKVLVNLGTLLNQSLRTSWGQTTDAVAASELVRMLRRLTT